LRRAQPEHKRKGACSMDETYSNQERSSPVTAPSERIRSIASTSNPTALRAA
jgi:hypothetical protein